MIIRADIERIAITLTIHDGEIIGKSFGLVSETACMITDCGSGEQLGDFRFGEDLSLETAIVVGEFYLHKGDWKFNAVGSGFNGGLSKLVTNFGLEVEEEVAAAAEPVAKPAAPIEKSPPEPVHKPAPAAESTSPVQLSKVSLEKQGGVNIRKSGKVTARLEHVEQYSKRFTEKSPLLYEDGSFKMNVSKAEFKSWR